MMGTVQVPARDLPVSTRFKRLGSAWCVRAAELLAGVQFEGYFDADYYLARYPDVADSGIDPLFHFLWWGGRERRLPSRAFDTEFYLASNPDVARSHINPLLHYLRYGKREGRPARPIRTFRMRTDALSSQERLHDLYNPRLQFNRYSSKARVLRRGTVAKPDFRVSSAVDTVVVLPSGDAVISGWCFADDGVLPHHIYFETLEGPIEAFRNQPRTDVAQAVEDGTALPSGFVGHVPLRARSRQVRVVAEFEDGAVVLVGKVKTPARSRPKTRVPRPPFGSYSDYLESESLSSECRVPGREVSGPLISVILPTYNSNLYFLSRCLESIRNQTYAKWQLCIADDASSRAAVPEFLEKAAAADERIRLCFRTNTGHISRASNSALELATGDYVTFVDHDDALHPEALAEVAAAVQTAPSTRLVYSDEDKIDHLGRRLDPVFKPGYSLEILRAFDYLGHLICIERRLVNQLGGFRPECTGSQDWDLLLRVAEQLQPDEVRHIARPLYHWRKHPNSTAMNVDVKPYVRAAWSKVLGDHAERAGTDAIVEPGLFDGSMRLRMQAPDSARVIIVVPPNTLRDYERVFLRRSTRLAVRLVDLKQAFMSPADSDVMILVNSALESVNHSFLEDLVAEVLRPECAIVAPLIVSAKRRLLDGGLLIDAGGHLRNPYRDLEIGGVGYMGLAKVKRRVDLVSGICYASRPALLARASAVHPEADWRSLVISACAIAAGEGRPALVTPFCIATCAEAATPDTVVPLEMFTRLFSEAGGAWPIREGVSNPNLSLFGDIETILKDGIS